MALDASKYCSDSLHVMIQCVHIPRAQMTSIFEGQPSKTRPFSSKTRVIWVLGVYIYIYIYIWPNYDISPTADCPEIRGFPFLSYQNWGEVVWGRYDLTRIYYMFWKQELDFHGFLDINTRTCPLFLTEYYSNLKFTNLCPFHVWFAKVSDEHPLDYITKKECQKIKTSSSKQKPLKDGV